MICRRCAFDLERPIYAVESRSGPRRWAGADSTAPAFSGRGPAGQQSPLGLSSIAGRSPRFGSAPCPVGAAARCHPSRGGGAAPLFSSTPGRRPGRAGLCPVSYAEQVARDQVIEELLDRVGGGGPTDAGDLRDTLARNRLKLADLAGPGEFLTGDPLLRANYNLACALDGVYRRGEIYRRGLQRFSSLFFGTRPGRFLFMCSFYPLSERL